MEPSYRIAQAIKFTAEVALCAFDSVATAAFALKVDRCGFVGKSRDHRSGD